MTWWGGLWKQDLRSYQVQYHPLTEVCFENKTTNKCPSTVRPKSGGNVGFINRAPPILADLPLSAPADMPPADWTNIFFNLALNDAIAVMDDDERSRTLDRLREAIARCPDSLGCPSFWAHMQSCSVDEWDRTMARIHQVGAPPVENRPRPIRSTQAMLCGHGMRWRRSAASTPRR